MVSKERRELDAFRKLRGNCTKDEVSMLERRYLNIEGWMVTQLGLKGAELIVYAIIFGFAVAPSQMGKLSVSVPTSYLTLWSGLTRQSVYSTTKKLEGYGYIKIEKNGNGTNSYIMDFDVIEQARKNMKYKPME